MSSRGISSPLLLLLLFICLHSATTTAAIEKRFVYLVQHDEWMDLSHLRSADVDAILLVWKVKPADNRLLANGGDTIWEPSLSLTEGRNKLLEVARSLQGKDYLYYIMRDGDLDLQERADFGKNTGDPFRTFEKYLLEWEPAVGTVSYDFHPALPDKEIQLGYNYDQIIVAFHWQTLGILLPYTTRYLQESWHHCGRINSLLAAAFYNEHRIQFNALVAVNHHHANYPQLGGYEKPLNFVLGALRLYPQLNLLHFMNTGAPLAREGSPKRPAAHKLRPYVLEHLFFNPCHPLFVENPYFPEFYPNIVNDYWNEGLCVLDIDRPLTLALGRVEHLDNQVAELTKRLLELEKRDEEKSRKLEELEKRLQQQQGGGDSSSKDGEGGGRVEL